jgi:hypothetical protein
MTSKLAATKPVIAAQMINAVRTERFMMRLNLLGEHPKK